MRTRNKKKKILLIAIIFFGLISGFSLLSLLGQGQFKQLNFIDLPCKNIRKIPGAEDLALNKKGFLFLASQDRQSPIYEQIWPQGSIFGIPLEDSKAKAIDLKNSSFPSEFHPRALGIFENSEGTSLFVVNYRKNGFTIEVFGWKDNILSHQKTITSPLFIQPSGIAVISHKQFYILNEYGLYTTLGHAIEDLLQLKKSHMLYFDGKSMRKTKYHFRQAFGITFNPQMNALFVSDQADKSIHRVDLEKGTQEKVLSLPSHPAHLNWDASTQKIWLAAHPKLIQLKSHSLDPRAVPSPTQVIAISYEEKSSIFRTNEVMTSINSKVSGGTSVLPWKSEILIGAAFENGIARCRTQQSSS